MTHKLPPDFREQIARGISAHALAERYRVSSRTAYRWLHAFGVHRKKGPRTAANAARARGFRNELRGNE
jgi:transposase